MSRNPPHGVGVALMLKALNARLPAGWHCRVQSSVTADLSNPEPDVAIVRGNERDYINRHPRPRDTGLITEVADTTLQTDREVKGALYARVGVPVYWILNLVESQLEVFTDPTGPDPEPCYRQHRDYRSDEEVTLVLDGREVARIPVRDLLP
jgi:Uma2 family endonuclease